MAAWVTPMADLVFGGESLTEGIQRRWDWLSHLWDG